jgi:cysteine desulfurase family protein (TIGR01976 family)
VSRPGAPVFFDNPGGTQVPREVVEAMSGYLTHGSSNAGGAFAVSERTDDVAREAHAAMADLVGAEHGTEVSFGPNMTTLTFSLSRALGRELREGDEIVVTNLDHDANVAPWLLLARDLGLRVRTADIDPNDCTLDLRSFEEALDGRPRVVAFTYASNATGTVNDIRHLTHLAHEAGALVYIDAVQYAPHGPMDARETGCDFLVCSPYKFFSPHAGVLYARLEHSERLEAYKVRPAKDAPPHKWETGTPSFEAMAGTTAAVDYLASLSPEGAGKTRRQRLTAALCEISAYERDLSRQLLEGLQDLPVRVHGIADTDRLDHRVPTFAITAKGHHPRNLAVALAGRGYNLWSGNYYALAVMQRLGLEESGGALRIGLAHYNTRAEVASFLTDLSGLLRT